VEHIQVDNNLKLGHSFLQKKEKKLGHSDSTMGKIKEKKSGSAVV
jgi:hypothetical protein